MARKLASVPYAQGTRPTEPVRSKLLQGPVSMKAINNDYLLKKRKKLDRRALLQHRTKGVGKGLRRRQSRSRSTTA